ncbi:hypothetical protein MKX01_030336 [Papaver californicum]|nr:hypothetical protein MKX01_030336 [Papaver californicum]
MSSHHSIGIVFKCMLKGADDFLVKPVRKNELRNLWQHVWRKYYSSCGKLEKETESAQKLEKSMPKAENIICCEGTNPELGKMTSLRQCQHHQLLRRKKEKIQQLKRRSK